MFLPTLMNLKKTMGKHLKAVTLNQHWLWLLTAGFHSQGCAQAMLHMSFLWDPTLESSTIGQFSTFSSYFFWAYYLLWLGMLHLLLVWEIMRLFTKGSHLLKGLIQLGINTVWKKNCLLGWLHLQGVVALQFIVEVPPSKSPRILTPSTHSSYAPCISFHC